MKATVINGEIVIDGTDSEIKYLAQVLSYKDKQKEYQLKKMQQNPYLRNSAAYKKLIRSLLLKGFIEKKGCQKGGPFFDMQLVLDAHTHFC